MRVKGREREGDFVVIEWVVDVEEDTPSITEPECADEPATTSDVGSCLNWARNGALDTFFFRIFLMVSVFLKLEVTDCSRQSG